MLAEVRAIVLRAAGINCDMETEYALEVAGAEAERVHINSIIEDMSMLDDFQMIVFPGGFSYGDDVAAGKILANQVIHHLYEPLRKFIDDGKLVLGICNGFQVLVKTGILPANDSAETQSVTITYNDGKREVFDAIYIRDTGVYTGIVLNIDNHEVFVESGGIPKNIVKHIEWDSKKTVLRKTA